MYRIYSRIFSVIYSPLLYLLRVLGRSGIPNPGQVGPKWPGRKKCEYSVGQHILMVVGFGTSSDTVLSDVGLVQNLAQSNL